jgi:hypothetical protein
MYKTSVPRVNPRQSELMVVFPFSKIIPSHPTCYVTHACSIYGIEEGCVVFYKDLLHINALDTQLKGMIYKTLQAVDVRYVPYCLVHGEVKHLAQ